MITAQAPDLELQWVRDLDETAEKFSRRIANDVLSARGLPPLPGRPPLALREGSPPPKVNHRNEPQHKGSKLADPNVPERPRLRPHTPRAAHYKPRVKVAAE